MKKCLKCNAMYDDGVNYCTKCGSELVSDEKDQAEVNQNKNKFLKKKIMLPIRLVDNDCIEAPLTLKRNISP